MEPAGITPPTKWTGALAEAYEAELARLGGLQAATPKPLYAALTAAGFEHITLQASRPGWLVDTVAGVWQLRAELASGPSSVGRRCRWPTAIHPPLPPTHTLRRL